MSFVCYLCRMQMLMPTTNDFFLCRLQMFVHVACGCDYDCDCVTCRLWQMSAMTVLCQLWLMSVVTVLCQLRLMSAVIEFLIWGRAACGNVTENLVDRSMSAVSHFIPPSLSVVLGLVAYLGCKLIELDVLLDINWCVRVDCDHSCASLAKDNNS